MKPRGFVEITLDGAMPQRYRLLNGTAIRTVRISRNIKQFQDKTIVIGAKFIPNAGTSEKVSTASPWTTRIQNRSEEHTSELQSLMRISYAVFCLKKKTNRAQHNKQ